MDWLSQNWIWIALAVGAFYFMTRMGGHGMGGFGMGGSMRHSYGGGRDVGPADGGTGPRAAVDPVSKHAVAGGTAISSVYRNQAYYFETRENRDAFEAAPEKYLAGMAPAGQAIDDYRDDDRPRRHRHGC